jgi:hypothetical protein
LGSTLITNRAPLQSSKGATVHKLFGLLDGSVIVITDEGRGVYEMAVIADSVGSIIGHSAARYLGA